MDAALHRTLPRDDIALAINSATARSQNQLHIHVDCLSIPVIEALHSHLGITFYNATGLLIDQSIVAHNGNGSSSWSSGVNLFHVSGDFTTNIVRRTVSFESASTISRVQRSPAAFSARASGVHCR